MNISEVTIWLVNKFVTIENLIVYKVGVATTTERLVFDENDCGST